MRSLVMIALYLFLFGVRLPFLWLFCVYIFWALTVYSQWSVWT